jgi:hypothetical protein
LKAIEKYRRKEIPEEICSFTIKVEKQRRFLNAIRNLAFICVAGQWYLLEIEGGERRSSEEAVERGTLNS